MRYTHEDVKKIYNDVLAEVELDLVHQIKHSKEADKFVAKLQVFDLVSRGINHKLTEELSIGQ